MNKKKWMISMKIMNKKNNVIKKFLNKKKLRKCMQL